MPGTWQSIRAGPSTSTSVGEQTKQRLTLGQDTVFGVVTLRPLPLSLTHCSHYGCPVSVATWLHAFYWLGDRKPGSITLLFKIFLKKLAFCEEGLRGPFYSLLDLEKKNPQTKSYVPRFPDRTAYWGFLSLLFMALLLQVRLWYGQSIVQETQYMKLCHSHAENQNKGPGQHLP